ncbi:methyltransferase domain-containing protein [Paeniroseomonas aquatica]|uniref:Methyltransferase domain-containing protein n=1 Tax=Paeniroseomonas aquatica TaxID=373043 RepID=A0ABT8A0W0_9PROT|nr:methyltransferase domain-containing protein [Paeniroseomonas aquatica]MDN3563370.1 methyltransferase domain-containing protein [Paeniroseomonas aquatica]
MSHSPLEVFDRRLVRLRRDRAAATVAQVAPVLEAAAERLLDRLDDTTRRFSRALEIGGRGVVAPLLRARGIPLVVSMDLSARMAAGAGGLPLAGDEEALPFAPESFDLIVANLSLHWVNDLPGALVQLRRALRPDGLFLASLPGLGTLQELREALAGAESALRGGLSPRVSPFPELRDLAGLLQRAGFALPVADGEGLPVRYRTPLALLHDLRAAGEANAVLARDARVPPRALLPMALASLPRDAAGIPVTLRLLVMTGWAPHESQSRPARPGSANARLADALGAEERSAGEKAG